MDCDPERIWRIVESNRQNIPPKPGNKLADKLHNSFVEHTNDKSDKRIIGETIPQGQPFRSAVNLMRKVDNTTILPVLVVNLYDDDKGYSVVLHLDSGDNPKCVCLPYEEDYIFQFLDNEQIPPVILEILQNTECSYSHNESLVCEVRDHRQHTSDIPEVHLLVLHPTPKGLSHVVHEVAQQCSCSMEEELFLEAHLLEATQTPLCLDPSTDVACVNNRLCFNQLKFNSTSVSQYLRRRSHANRQQRVRNSVRGIAPELQQRQSKHRKLTETWKVRRKTDADQIKIDGDRNLVIAEAIQEIARLSRSHQVRKSSIEDMQGKISSPRLVEEITPQTPPRPVSVPPEPPQAPRTPVTVTYSPKAVEEKPQATSHPHTAELRSPPPLNLWHPLNHAAKNRLPKLHPLMNKHKTVVKNVSGSPVAMPQLHRMSTT